MSGPDDSTSRLVIELRWNRRIVLSTIVVLVVAAISLSATVALARVGLNVPSRSSEATVPSMVSYQGRVTVNGQPFNGVGRFKFALVDATGTTAYWSNDGTGLASAPFTPTASVTLAVGNGLFNVLLGDTSLPVMTQPITPDLFRESNRALRVWFNDGVHGFQRLTPDVALAAVPFALNAETLDGQHGSFYQNASNINAGTLVEAGIDPLVARDSEIVPAVAAAGFITQGWADMRYGGLARTPQQIALLKWYTAISTTQSNITVGNAPAFVAFDGGNVWVTNAGDGTVNVLRVSDAFRVMTITFGGLPMGIGFDGVNMWVPNFGPGGSGSNVTVWRASDGTLAATHGTGNAPFSTAFDGENMWIVNQRDNTVSVLRASDGFHVMTQTVGNFPQGIAFDGTNMWIANYYSNTVSVIRASDGVHVMTPTVGTGPIGIAFDGTNMWIANYGDGLGSSVTVLRASDGSLVATYPAGPGPHSIAFDGAYMWVTNNNHGSGNTVTVLRASDGAFVQSVPVGPGPTGIAFDGTNMWIANTAGNTVSKR